MRTMKSIKQADNNAISGTNRDRIEQKSPQERYEKKKVEAHILENKKKICP